MRSRLFRELNLPVSASSRHRRSRCLRREYGRALVYHFVSHHHQDDLAPLFAASLGPLGYGWLGLPDSSYHVSPANVSDILRGRDSPPAKSRGDGLSTMSSTFTDLAVTLASNQLWMVAASTSLDICSGAIENDLCRVKYGSKSYIPIHGLIPCCFDLAFCSPPLTTD
ncbi:hypothetical protein PM082_004593 [Marasmius tenuissimus]|nr:hypothetical protein PM082_004593 [Marasmius tenuissimus]